MGSLRDELEGLIGPKGLRALSITHGGRRLYVPRKVRPKHWLAVRIGQQAADALAWTYGGCRIAIPSSRRAERDAAIRRDRAEGCSVPEIAAKWRLSERQVYRILGSRDSPRC